MVFCVHLKQCLFPAITLFTVFSLFTKHPTRCVVNSVALMNKSHVRPQWNCYSYLIVQEDTEGLVQGMPCLVFFLLETRSQMMGQFKWLRALNHYLESASVVILRQLHVVYISNLICSLWIIQASQWKNTCVFHSIHLRLKLHKISIFPNYYNTALSNSKFIMELQATM